PLSTTSRIARPSLCSSIPPRPPTPPLFPYTTLFRSVERVGGGRQPLSCIVEAAVRDQRLGRNERRLQRVERRRPGLQHFVGADEDRKSTRLNSSHLGISYAVFCLKKKNNKEKDSTAA